MCVYLVVVLTDVHIAHGVWTYSSNDISLTNVFAQKEFFPQLEKWGVYIPGPIGGYFRAVGKWKKVGKGLDNHRCLIADTESMRKQSFRNVVSKEQRPHFFDTFSMRKRTGSSDDLSQTQKSQKNVWEECKRRPLYCVLKHGSLNTLTGLEEAARLPIPSCIYCGLLFKSRKSCKG
jgi:hypothetical protein